MWILLNSRLFECRTLVLHGEREICLGDQRTNYKIRAADVKGRTTMNHNCWECKALLYLAQLYSSFFYGWHRDLIEPNIQNSQGMNHVEYSRNTKLHTENGFERLQFSLKHLAFFAAHDLQKVKKVYLIWSLIAKKFKRYKELYHLQRRQRSCHLAIATIHRLGTVLQYKNSYWSFWWAEVQN